MSDFVTGFLTIWKCVSGHYGLPAAGFAKAMEAGVTPQFDDIASKTQAPKVAINVTRESTEPFRLGITGKLRDAEAVIDFTKASVHQLGSLQFAQFEVEFFARDQSATPNSIQ